jgi:uncharacterized protein (DUF1786 family)
MGFDFHNEEIPQVFDRLRDSEIIWRIDEE